MMKNQEKGSNHIYHQRKAQLDALNGEYNGWWIYEYCKDAIIRYQPKGR